jgi:hypothetical protein
LQSVEGHAVGLRMDFVRVDFRLQLIDVVEQEPESVRNRSRLCAYDEGREFDLDGRQDVLCEQACDGDEQDCDACEMTFLHVTSLSEL